MRLKFHTRSFAVSHKGNVRAVNEDACLDLGEHNLWVVADGMGGHAQGDYASQMIVEKLGLIAHFDRPSDFVDAVEDTLVSVNNHLHDKSASAPEPTIIGSTVVAMMAFEAFCVLTWAGDSRGYLLRDGNLQQVTRDHSEVQDLVDQGLVKPEDAESHPQANVVTRAVGGTRGLTLDYRLSDMRTGDRFLLCSDGLFKDVLDPEIAAVLGEGATEEAASALLNTVLSRECRDNVTILLVDVGAEVADGVSTAQQSTAD